MPKEERCKIIKHPDCIGRFVEQTPVVYKERLMVVTYVEDVPPLVPKTIHANPRIAVVDWETRQTLATLAHGFSYPCAYVERDTLYIFASSTHDQHGVDARGPFDIHVFYSPDLKTWASRLVVPHDEGLRNCKSSVCRGRHDYVMAYASVWRGTSCARFARSQDLFHWTKVPNITWRREKYTGCPIIRHHEGWYYLLYLNQTDDRWHFETHIARSKDLANWEESSRNPVLTPQPDEGINNSDIDLVEHDSMVKMFYYTGDQRGSGKLKLATFDGTLGQLLEGFFS